MTVGVNPHTSPTRTPRAVCSGGWRLRLSGMMTRYRTRRPRPAIKERLAPDRDLTAFEAL